jgi:hypothetical protein
MTGSLARCARRAFFTLTAAAALGASALSVPAAATGSAGKTADTAVTVAKAKKTVPDLRKYWTPERMKVAKPVPMPRVPKPSSAAQVPTSPHLREVPSTVSADAEPPKKAAESRLGALSSTATEISVSQKWPGPLISWPMNATGKLFFDDLSGEPHECTASVIVSNTKSALWTAGHCIHEGTGGQAGFYQNVAFAPAWNGDAPDPAPWGMWDASNLIVPDAWANDETDKSLIADFGAVVLSPLPEYGNIQNAIGGYGYSFGSGSDYQDILDFGYPGDGYNRPDSDFNDAKNLFFCEGNVEDASNFNPLDNRMKMDCDMGHGASGGPMLEGFPINPQIVGANSHFEANDAGQRISDALFSSEHGVLAVNVINKVNGM